MNTVLDAIILAGDQGAARPVGDRNKALLPLGGQALVQHVLRALGEVDRIRRIALVGPATDLRPVVAAANLAKPVALLEQQATAYRNFWSAFTHLGNGEGDDPDRPVLLVSADIPLISAAEVNEFLDHCDLERLDYCVGMTDERHLERFYPCGRAPGIRMRYLHLADGSLRLNNLHLVKPLRVANRDYIEEVYEFRYQHNLWNMLRAARDLLRQPGIGWRALYLYLLLQFAELGHGLRWRGARDYFSRRVTRPEVSRIASRVLQARVGIVETTIGGCAIDVDNARDYAALQARWEEFTRLPPPNRGAGSNHGR